MNVRATATIELLETKQTLVPKKDADVRLLVEIEKELDRRGPASIAASLLQYRL